MRSTIPSTPLAPPETVGAKPFQGPDKAVAVACLRASIDSFLAAHRMSREQLAEDVCGISRPYFTKLENAEQGDFLAFVMEKLPADIRKDFIERLAEQERLDPFALAVEQVMVACIRLIRTQRRAMPAKAERMAKAEPLEAQKVRRA